MQNLIRFFIQYGNILTFVLLEIFCFSLIIDRNQKQREIFTYSKSLFTGMVLEKSQNIKDYLHLTSITDSLSKENAKLRSHLRDLKFSSSIALDSVALQGNNKKYNIIAAEVIGNSVHLRNNRMLINKGKSDGVDKGMGIVVEDGVVGIITRSNEHYSDVLPIANTQSRIAVSIKRTNYFGLLRWRGTDPTSFVVEDVPIHADVVIGDTIVTSGYSTIFPKGIQIGTVYRIDEKGGSTYQLRTKIKVDLARLQYVYVMDNVEREKIELLINQE